MLDIIITHYREDWTVCKKQFQMLDLQRCVDWKQIHVTVINDGGQHLPEDKLADLSFPMKQVDIPHGGISRARNAGIDTATEPWIMFLDCDDCFANVYALYDIMNILNMKDCESNFDMMWCDCLEEDYIKGAQTLYLMPYNKIFVFCHGKVYRRKFLADEGIRFDPELRFNEDSCFNAVIIARTPHTKIGQIKTHAPVYTWIRRENSGTMGTDAPDAGAWGQFQRNLKVTEENRLHRKPENYAGMVTRTAYDTYYMMHDKRISPQMKRRISDEFIPWMRERVDVFGKVSKEIMEQIRTVSRSELVEPGEKVLDSHKIVRAWVHKITGVRA